MSDTLQARFGAHRKLIVTVFKLLPALCTATMLGACGGGGSGGGSATADTAAPATSAPDGASNTAAPATGSVTLSWEAPKDNTDGSKLKDLAGFRVYYGTSTDNLDQVVDIPGPKMTGCTIEDLTAGAWYFAATAYSSEGIESDRSGVVSKAVG